MFETDPNQIQSKFKRAAFSVLTWWSHWFFVHCGSSPLSYKWKDEASCEQNLDNMYSSSRWRDETLMRNYS